MSLRPAFARRALARAVLALAGALALVPRPAAAAAFRKGPYLQNVRPDGVTILWESDAALPGRVIVRPTGEPERAFEAPAVRLHEVRVDGLEPGRRYAYVVEAGGERAGGEFGTAPGPDEPFSFVAFGDSRSNPEAHRMVVERVRSEVPDFMLATGDMVNEGSQERDWQVFFDIERDLLAENVLFPAIGNHDREGGSRGVENYRKWFSLPDDSPQPERYYAFSYGNSRFLVLDSNVHSFALTDQTAWLRRELEASVAAGARHLFVVMHHPPYSLSLHGGHAELRETWAPIFARYGVDAVFSGHDHCYGRAEHDGVRYFITGGAGAPLYPRDPRPAREDVAASVYFERTFNYLRVQVAGDYVELTAFRDDGSLIESLSWGAMPELAPVTGPGGADGAAAGGATATAAAARIAVGEATPPAREPGSAGGCAAAGTAAGAAGRRGGPRAPGVFALALAALAGVLGRARRRRAWACGGRGAAPSVARAAIARRAPAAAGPRRQSPAPRSRAGRRRPRGRAVSRLGRGPFARRGSPCRSARRRARSSGRSGPPSGDRG